MAIERSKKVLFSVNKTIFFSFRLLEHDHIGLAEKPSMEISEKSSHLDLKETELRLGLPGSQSPERKPTTVISLFGNDLQNNTNSLKNLVAGSKRGFSDEETVVGFEGKRNNTHKAYQSAEPDQEDKKKPEVSATNEHTSPPSAKALIVGWPPIRSFRRNTMASTSLTKNKDDEEEGKAEASGCLYVKVSMDGAPYLRKVDLRMYTNYLQLSSALDQMFTCFAIGECNSGGFPGKDGMSESSLRDLLHVCEYVVTYEDKDGDWMLVGDVPWKLFTESCRRLRIMKGSEAIGLAPRAMEKCRSHNNSRRIK